MNPSPCFRFLRPHLQRVPQILSAPKRAAYLQFYSAARKFSNSKPLDGLRRLGLGQIHHANNEGEHNGNCGNVGVANLQNPEALHTSEVGKDDIQRRINELEAANALKYLRIENDEKIVTCGAFCEHYSSLKPGESLEEENYTIHGMFYDTSAGD